MTISDNTIVAVIGLGYVGLPLAVEFGKKYSTLGYDISESKVESYKNFIDPTGEVSTEGLKASTKLVTSTDPEVIGKADVIVITVPTPVNEAHAPDFSPLTEASVMAGRHMKRGAIVVYESTVYPGATEEVCIPLLEQNSGMKWSTESILMSLPPLVKFRYNWKPEPDSEEAKLYNRYLKPQKWLWI